jgi:hypothetical protein
MATWLYVAAHGCKTYLNLNLQGTNPTLQRDKCIHCPPT